jgi:hypothetical protein
MILSAPARRRASHNNSRGHARYPREPRTLRKTRWRTPALLQRTGENPLLDAPKRGDPRRSRKTPCAGRGVLFPLWSEECSERRMCLARNTAGVTSAAPVPPRRSDLAPSTRAGSIRWPWWAPAREPPRRARGLRRVEDPDADRADGLAEAPHAPAQARRGVPCGPARAPVDEACAAAPLPGAGTVRRDPEGHRRRYGPVDRRVFVDTKNGRIRSGRCLARRSHREETLTFLRRTSGPPGPCTGTVRAPR